MQRKWKKATSATVAGAIIAAQALMQVSAAGGTINAEMSTKSPILRVQVPTKMAVAVNEFEMGDTGSQVSSDKFDMKNLSEIPVNVKVTSTAELGANVALVSTREAAQSSTDTAKPAMWLAAVAAVNNTPEYATGTDKTIGGVTGSEDNATAFGAKDTNNKSKAVQSFYLQAATAAQYKAAIGDATGDIGAGADFYALTEISGLTDAASATAAAADKDIYVIKDGTAPSGTTAVAIAKIDAGATVGAGDWTDNTSKAYSVAAAPTAFATVAADSSGIYLYVDSATTATGDAASFRYAGALSTAKSGWSSTDDLKGIEIKYDITGISATAYGDVEDDLTYGFKAENSALTLENGVLTAKIAVADFASGSLKIGDTTAELGSKAGAWGTTDDGDVTFTFNATWADAMKGKTCIATINLKDGSTLTATFDVPN